MCGIVGLIGSYNMQREHMFEDMMIMATLRGQDSCGAAFIRQWQDEQVYIKAAWLPHFLMEDKEWKEQINKLNNNALIGHCRRATKGKVTDDNAHPFQHGDITLVHNGGISHLKLDKQFETDSEGICFSISKVGIKETWKQLNGAAALAWWDNKDKTLNLVRNWERPMSFSRIKDGGVAFASEGWMIQAAAARRKIDLVGSVLSIEPHHLWTFKVDGKEVIEKSEKIEERKIISYAKGAISTGPFLPPKHQHATKRGLKGSNIYTLDPNMVDAEERLAKNLKAMKINHLDQRTLEFPKGREAATAALLAEFRADSKKLQANNNQTDDEWNSVYKSCAYCTDTLLGQRSTAIQIDRHKAICEGCARDAASLDMNIKAF